MELIKVKHRKPTRFLRFFRNEPSYKWTKNIYYTVELTKKEFDILLEALQDYAAKDKAEYEKERNKEKLE